MWCKCGLVAVRVQRSTFVTFICSAAFSLPAPVPAAHVDHQQSRQLDMLRSGCCCSRLLRAVCMAQPLPCTVQIPGALGLLQHQAQLHLFSLHKCLCRYAVVAGPDKFSADKAALLVSNTLLYCCSACQLLGPFPAGHTLTPSAPRDNKVKLSVWFGVLAGAELWQQLRRRVASKSGCRNGNGTHTVVTGAIKNEQQLRGIVVLSSGTLPYCMATVCWLLAPLFWGASCSHSITTGQCCYKTRTQHLLLVSCRCQQLW